MAELAGVTVRTLHHYDEIGLLSPSGRTSAGYRRYGDADLERLQQVRYYRELGFPLEEISAIIDRPGAARRPPAPPARAADGTDQAVAEMVAAIEFAMEANKMGIQLTPEERFEVFGDFDPEEHEAEGSSAGATPTRTGSRSGGPRATRRRTGCAQGGERGWGRRIVAVMASGAPADSRGDGPGRGAPAANRPLVLRVLVRDPHRVGRHVPRRRAVHRDYEKIAPGWRSTCTTRFGGTLHAAPADPACDGVGS